MSPSDGIVPEILRFSSSVKVRSVDICIKREDTVPDIWLPSHSSVSS